MIGLIVAHAAAGVAAVADALAPLVVAVRPDPEVAKARIAARVRLAELRHELRLAQLQARAEAANNRLSPNPK